MGASVLSPSSSPLLACPPRRDKKIRCSVHLFADHRLALDDGLSNPTSRLLVARRRRQRLPSDSTSAGLLLGRSTQPRRRGPSSGQHASSSLPLPASTLPATEHLEKDGGGGREHGSDPPLLCFLAVFLSLGRRFDEIRKYRDERRMLLVAAGGFCTRSAKSNLGLF